MNKLDFRSWCQCELTPAYIFNRQPTRNQESLCWSRAAAPEPLVLALQACLVQHAAAASAPDCAPELRLQSERRRRRSILPMLSKEAAQTLLGRLKPQESLTSRKTAQAQPKGFLQVLDCLFCQRGDLGIDHLARTQGSRCIQIFTQNNWIKFACAFMQTKDVRCILGDANLNGQPKEALLLPGT